MKKINNPSIYKFTLHVAIRGNKTFLSIQWGYKLDIRGGINNIIYNDTSNNKSIINVQ